MAGRCSRCRIRRSAARIKVRHGHLRYGHSDQTAVLAGVAPVIALLTSREDISFYRQMKNGATTIAEYWTGHRSQCHPMFGAVSRYLFEYILGIRQTEHSAGFRQVVIEPKCRNLVPSARGHITTLRGEISVEYGAEYIEGSVPRDTEAVLRVSGTEYPIPPGETVRI